MDFLLLPLLSVCLLSCSGTTSGATVKVNVGSEAVLPCFIRPERDITRDVFDWKKDGQKEVFFYERGSHYNNGREGQDEQFKGRVFHFPEQLQFSNASIRIRSTIMNDSGTYTCDYSPDQPNRQRFNIDLVVAACRKPSVTILEATNHWAILQCEVQGASSKPIVQWRDSAGNNLTAEETPGPMTGGNNDIILKTTVTKTDKYRCVVIQEEICHQIFKEIFVNILDPEPTKGATVVKVREGSEAVLPCFISPKLDITQNNFEWKKNGQKVFFYERGSHYNNGLPGQDEQFKGRVSHFQDQLKSGNASIKIRDTKLSDSGTYTCDYSPDEPNRQRFNIELDVVAVVRVTEGSEAVLPCFIRPERNIIREYFDWRKDGQKEKEVFEFSEGKHDPSRQDEQFKGRVSHFPEQLQSGNASIKINNTKPSDSGNYTCDFPRLQPKGQKFYIELVVGAVRRPSVTILKTVDGALLHCEVEGASPKPKVEWQDSAGNLISAEEPQVSERGGSYHIILQTTVTKTDNFYCVVTQEEINHQTKAEIYVPAIGPEPPRGSSTGLVVAVAVLSIILLFVLPLVLYMRRKIQLLTEC